MLAKANCCCSSYRFFSTLKEFAMLILVCLHFLHSWDYKSQLFVWMEFNILSYQSLSWSFDVFENAMLNEMFALVWLRQPQYNVWALGDGKDWKLITRVVSHIHHLYARGEKVKRKKNTLMKKMQLHSFTGLEEISSKRQVCSFPKDSENCKTGNGCYKNANKVFQVWR